MHKRNLQYLLCPECGASRFDVESYAVRNDETIEGRLICGGCKLWFRIEEAVTDLLPLSLRRDELYAAFAARHGLDFAGAQRAGASADKLHQMAFYAGDVDEYEDKLVNTGFWKALDANTFVDWMHRSLRPGQRAVEIGCGSGRICVRVAQHGVEVIGLDISEEMVRHARKRAEAAGVSDKVELLVGDGEKPPVIDGAFDASVLHGMLHHVPHPDAAIASAAKKLKSRGLVYTFDPHKSPVRPVFDFMMKLWKLYNEEARDEPLFTEAQLTDWFSRAGFRADIKLTTYLPPHVLYLFSEGINRRLLSVSDALLTRIPGVRKWAGVVVGEGQKIA